MIANLAELLIDPLALLFLLVMGIAVLVVFYQIVKRGKPLTAMFISLLVACVFWLCSAPAVVNPLLERLENRVDVDEECIELATPLVVLSGGVSSRVQSPSQLGAMYRPTFARVSAAVALIQRQDDDYPVFAVGGSTRNGIAESDVMAYFLEKTGLPKARLRLERVSSNTADSAAKLAQMLDSESLGREIRLMTSALHMARAKAVFEKNGVDVCAIPVDRQAIPNVRWITLLPQTTALVKFDMLLHEWVGWLVYRSRGLI